MSSQPLKYELLDEQTRREIPEQALEYVDGFVRIGEKKWFTPKTYLEQSEKFRKFETRPCDTWVISQARSGTTWTQEMVWLVANNLDYETAQKYKLDARFPYIDYDLLVPGVPLKEYYNLPESEAEKVKLANQEGKSLPEIFAFYPSPRFIKSHFPFCLLPENLFESGCKIVYVARNPKDVIVSAYHFYKNLTFTYQWKSDFKTFWHLFKRDLILYTPYWEHLKDAWNRRNDPNFLFVFYEDMRNNMPKVLEKVAKFFGKNYSSEEIAKLADHLHFKNFQKNNSVNQNHGLELTVLKPNSFIRKGQVGGWKEEFTPELEAEADEWIKENLKDTDLRFPIQL